MSSQLLRVSRHRHCGALRHSRTARRGLENQSIKTARYSQDLPTRLSERYADLMDDGELLSVRDDIALLGAAIGQTLMVRTLRRNREMVTEEHPLAHGTTPRTTNEEIEDALEEGHIDSDLGHLERINARFRWVGGWQYERARAYEDAIKARAATQVVGSPLGVVTVHQPPVQRCLSRYKSRA